MPRHTKRQHFLLAAAARTLSLAAVAIFVNEVKSLLPRRRGARARWR